MKDLKVFHLFLCSYIKRYYFYRVEIKKKIMKNLSFQIGERVSWTVGKISHIGVFLDPSEINEEMSNVMLHSRNGIIDCREVEVLTNLLKLVV